MFRKGNKRWAASSEGRGGFLRRGGGFLRTLWQCGGPEGVRPPPADALCVSLIYNWETHLLPLLVQRKPQGRLRVFKPAFCCPKFLGESSGKIWAVNPPPPSFSLWLPLVWLAWMAASSQWILTLKIPKGRVAKVLVT